MQQVALAAEMPAQLNDDLARQAQRIFELRAIGLHALKFGCGDLPMWAYFAELKQLSVPGLYPERLEARIAICRAAQIRPNAMRRSLSELHTIRKEAGQLDKFVSFEQAVHISAGERLISAHSFDGARFTELDHGPVWAQTRAHIDVLSAMGYDVFLNSGTLLGVVRDQKLIGHDDDVDLAVLLNSETYADIAAEWSNLRVRLAQSGALDEKPSEDPKIIKLKPVGAVEIDLFPGWIMQDQVFVYPHTFGQLSRDEVLPLAQCAVTGNPIPAEPEKMLRLNYGDDWQTPNPYWAFPWKRAKKQFRALREAMTAFSSSPGPNPDLK